MGRRGVVRLLRFSPTLSSLLLDERLNFLWRGGMAVSSLPSLLSPRHVCIM